MSSTPDPFTAPGVPRAHLDNQGVRDHAEGPPGPRTGWYRRQLTASHRGSGDATRRAIAVTAIASVAGVSRPLLDRGLRRTANDPVTASALVDPPASVFRGD